MSLVFADGNSVNAASQAMCVDSLTIPFLSQEVNVPLHEARYSELVGVDVSEESFQQLTTKPRTKPCVAEGRRRGKGGGRGVGGRESHSTGPNIMDLYPTFLFCGMS